MKARIALISAALGICCPVFANTPYTSTLSGQFYYDGLIMAPDGSGYFGQQWFENATEVTLYPKNGNTAIWTLTLTNGQGLPIVGEPVKVSAAPLTLTSPQWRDPTGMAARFSSSVRAKVLTRIEQGLFRLTAPYDVSTPVTDAKGQVVVSIDNFHSCGNDATPGTDQFIAQTSTQQLVLQVKCAVTGLVAIPDTPSQGLTTSGLVGRHLHPDLLTALQNLGQAWHAQPDKPAGMPDHLTITGATMRWGGINPPHFTHKFGGTVDIRPIGTQSGPISVGDAAYDRQATQSLVDALVQLGATQIIFADNLTGVTQVKANHKNHLHVSFLREPLEPWHYDESDSDDEGLHWHDYEGIYDTRYFIPEVKQLKPDAFKFNLKR
ncbi:hypothetical protein CWB99_11570 [Pseudoalteromonas rubra]|uniref:Uncharacterized protein n=1 Tax=Pseudoalteromonas rubra TaxID=43658 RepID=A0A5S3WLD1_9GAMM|nr:hypothetical protein [Pseudoalteromonas rubra]TMP28545.1 hypothetical protein CWB99_11570 [Pseudoalteromonas rubra]TMP30512.1 hypothetical protein CWC00_16690 [Pseudoalteromonas rubra]